MSSFNEEQALVAAANEAFYRALESLQLDRMQALWLRSDDIKCVHPGWELVYGWEQVMHSWALIFRHTARIRFELDDVAVVVNGGIGWVECLERIFDGEAPAGTAIATNLFQQNPDGRWLMIHHHASPLPRQIRSA